MGEVLPNAISLMGLAAKDAGLTLDGSVASMMALQQTGGLISEKVLPFFAKRMSEAARANGGLDKAMLSNRVAMNRLGLSFQEAGDLIFKSGFADGLTELFNETAKSVVALKPLWQSLGKIIGSVFSLISDGVKYLTPMLISMGAVLKSVTDQIGSGREYLLAMIGPAAWLGKIFGGWGAKAIPFVGQIAILLGMVKEIAFWAEEIDNLLFSRNKIGVLYDPREGINAARVASGGGAVAEGYINAIPIMGDFLKSIDKTVTDFTGLPRFFVENKMPAVNVTIGADAERMGVTIANSGPVKDAIQSEIRAVQN